MTNDITDDINIVSPVSSHSQTPVLSVFRCRTAVNAMCTTVDGNLLALMHMAFDSVVCSSMAEQVNDAPTSVRQILNRQCTLHVPRLPQMRTDVVTEGKWGEIFAPCQWPGVLQMERSSQPQVLWTQALVSFCLNSLLTFLRVTFVVSDFWLSKKVGIVSDRKL